MPLHADERVALRGLARKSLGDALRRVVEIELARGLELQQVEPVPTAGLPLQLPRKIQRQIKEIADQNNVSPVEIIRIALVQHLRRNSVFCAS